MRIRSLSLVVLLIISVLATVDTAEACWWKTRQCRRTGNQQAALPNSRTDYIQQTASTTTMTVYVVTCTYRCADGSSITSVGSGVTPAAAGTDAWNKAVLMGCSITGVTNCTITP